MHRLFRHARATAGAGLLAAALVTPVASAGTDDDPSRSGSLRALTYNVAGLPDDLSGSNPEVNSSLISPLLNDYDLVLLQENWADPLGEQRAAGLVPEEVPRFGYHDQVVGAARHPHRSEPAPAPPLPEPSRFPTGPALSADGLNRLSNFAFGPLQRVMWDECNGELALEVGETVLKEGGLRGPLRDAGLGVVVDTVDGGASDCAAQKGFSVARTELAPGVEVDVYNLHAEAGNGEADQQASRSGFRQLAAFVNQHSLGRAVILGGDTNLHRGRPDRVWEDEVWFTFLDETGLVDVCDAIHCGADLGAIDKFAFRSDDGIRIVPQSHRFERDVFVRADGEPLSDHDALAVTFRWVAPNSD